MNLKKLLHAETSFLAQYPKGFDDPGLAVIKRRHNVDKLAEFARDNLGRASFNRPEQVVDSVLKIVSRSSMVSRFEKPRFREFLAVLNSSEKEAMCHAIELRLYGRTKKRGFEELVGMLEPFKIAKWPIISIVPFSFAPQKEAFVKPTTAKKIIAKLEVEELHYRPLPTWEFYCGYRDLLDAIKKEISPSLSPNYAALTGFLMTSL